MLTESIISQEELASKDFLEKTQHALTNPLESVELVVVDESHNFRNPLSNRWENLFSLVNDHISKTGKRPHLVFLTATPINNTIWDLYFQILLLVNNNRKTFVKEGISDLLEFFKFVDKRGKPSLLNDLLNEISIRRTRDYIKKNYPNIELNGKKIIFPERIPKNINYRLGPTYNGMYRKISDAIAEDLTLAYYNLLNYKNVKLTTEEELIRGKMIALDGIFRTILLKRLESSVEAFRTSVNNQLKFLMELEKHLTQGKILTKKAFLKYILYSDNELDDYKEELRDIKLEEYDKKRLFNDIQKDSIIFENIFSIVENIIPEDDAKLVELSNILLQLLKDGQVIVFTYYADTLNYIFKNISQSNLFQGFKIRSISGTTPSSEREKIVNDFLTNKVDVLMSDRCSFRGNEFTISTIHSKL